MRLAAISRPSANSQRGAVVIMTVGFMLLAILFLALVVDTGRLYLDKRSLQRVADMAALEAITQNGVCRIPEAGELDAQTVAVVSAQRNNFLVGDGRTVLAECGEVMTVTGTRRFNVNPDSLDAVRVTVTRSVPASIIAGGIFGNNILLRAEATAARGSNNLAQLTIRSEILNIDASRGALLNSLVGGLLGGSLNVSVGGWQGLVGTNISLLEFSDQLATNLGLNLGGYDQVLSTNVSVGQLIDAAVDVLERDGNTASATITALQAIRLAAAASPANLQLGDILNLATGSESSGLESQVNLFDLVQGFAQLANSSSALAADVPISLPGLLNVNIKVKVTEPPLLSAIGNPALAKENPDGENRIFVRTAQARVLISLELGNVLLGSLQPLLNALSAVNNNQLVNATADLLGGNFIGFVGGLVGGVLDLLLPLNSVKDEVDIQIVNPLRIDIYVDGGGADAKVTDFSCSGEKALESEANTYTAKVLIGNLGVTYQDAVNNAFSSVNPIVNAGPVPILDIGSLRVRRRCTIGLCLLGIGVVTEYSRASNGAFTPAANVTQNRSLAFRTPFKGGGIGIDFINPGVLTSPPRTLTFEDPPSLNENLVDPDDYISVSSDTTQLVNSLSGTLANVQVKVFQPGVSNLLGNVLATAGTVINLVSNAARGLISGVLSPLLDPILNLVMQQLGVNLANADVAAKLTCGDESGVRLIQ
ncbi:MAG: pilus assembly protein TadG-related protein [Moraxellaceae bacterium]|nr:pilus assembly protein TadG-related protein [Moraxellaceae bacterium]